MTRPPRKHDQFAPNSGAPDVGNNARVADLIGTTGIELTEQRSKEIYLCVDRILVEFPETKMCPISNVHTLPDDEALFVKMREQLRSCNGWLKNMLSWKTCTRIKFVKFAVVKDRRVKALGFGRPIGHAEYEYTQSSHQAEHLEAYLDMIAEEVLRGIHDPGAGRDEIHLTDEIPNKRNPPQLQEVRGTEAYGLQAMQGLSLRRVCWWTAVSYTLGLAFVVFWLSFVDKLDLQNAFMPVTFLAAMLVGALATTQVLIAQCPNVPAPLFGYAVDPAYRAVKIAGNLANPRGVITDKAGRVLVLERGKGISQHTINSSGCISKSVTILSMPSLNHGIYFNSAQNKLYASSTTIVYSWTYNVSTGALGTTSTIVVKGMSNSGHATRTLTIPSQHPNLLVVSCGSNANIDAASISPSVARAIVKVFDLNSVPSGGYDYVTQGYNAGYGLRNEVGLDFDSAGMLWGVENSADDLTRTANGVTTDVHFNNPAEELNYLGDVSKPNNQWYGYPTCFTVGDPTQFKDKTNFVLGDQFVTNPSSTFNDTTCIQKSTPPRLVFPAHSAPLDCKFEAGSKNLWVTLHGSWDRSPPTGFGVVRVPFVKASDGSYAPAAARNQIGYVKVFSPKRADGQTCTASTCVRPVGLAFDSQGRLYMTSDASGELFMISKV
ncbi:hypothetical protein E8E14_006884 [Neopestalotiopsis sp. 37M]|nr:hypothetical protein E8E14_006884 [Neopestalotiopsis sp. 37M]